MPAEWVLGDSPLPSLQTTVFSFSLHVAESRERKQTLSYLFLSGLQSIHKGSTLMTSTPVPSHWGLGFQRMNFGGYELSTPF